MTSKVWIGLPGQTMAQVAAKFAESIDRTVGHWRESPDGVQEFCLRDGSIWYAIGRHGNCWTVEHA